MDHLNEDSKEGQRQRRIIKDYVEVEDLKEHMKSRWRAESANDRTSSKERVKEYSLRSKEKQSVMSNYVIQVVRSIIVQEQERQQLNMTHQIPVWYRTEEMNSNGHIIQEK